MTIPVIPSQNLINPVKVPEIGKPEGYGKALALDVVSIGSALLFGYVYFRYLNDGVSPWIVLSVSLVFSAATVLQTFLTKKVRRRAASIFGEVVGFLGFFVAYDPPQVTVGLAAVLFFVLFWGYLAGRSIAGNAVEVSFWRTTGAALGKVTTALLLFMILAYAPKAEGQGLFIPKDDFQTFYDWSAGLMTGFYPGVPFGGTFGDVTQKFAQMELANNPNFKALSPIAQKAALEQVVEQLSGSVTKATNITPSPSESTSDVVYQSFIAILGRLKDRLQDRFLIVWVAILFLALRGVGVVYVWLAQFFSLIIYEILIASGFMRILEVTHAQEVLEY